MAICYNCFKEYDVELGFCPFCGQNSEELPKDEYLLSPGTLLLDRYLIGKAVGSGGFGNVYKAWDKKLETIVAVKEYYPQSIVNRIPGTAEVVLVSGKNRKEFEYGKSRLLQEARNIAKFSSHKNIVNVFEFFEENNTSYMVMEYLHGMPLNKYLKECGGKLDTETATFVVSAVCDALLPLHKAGIIHRDISPDNIYVCENKVITLFDFGTAEFPDGKNELPVIVKQGFAPPEQYEQENRQGAWTDIYALGASLYLLLTGEKPDASPDRKVLDELKSPMEVNPEINEQLSNAVMKAMAIDMHMRFQNVSDFKKAIQGDLKVLPVEKERKRRKKRRLIGLVAALLVLVIGITGVFGALEYQKMQETLKPADITVWTLGDETSQQYVTMTKIVKQFNDAYPQVKVNVTVIKEDEYESKITKANENAELPHLFYSTDISDENLTNATDISPILKTKNGKNTYFLSGYKNKYKMPLGVNIPVTYAIVSGSNSISYSEDYFNELADLGDCKISVDKEYEDIISKTITSYSTGGNKELFFSGENQVLLSTTKDYFNVQSAFGGRYKVIGNNAEKFYCSFDNEWSVGNGTKDEIKAAKKLLEFMLSSASQDIIYFDAEEKSGILPLNISTFNSYINEIFPELQVISGAKDNYSFEENDNE